MCDLNADNGDVTVNRLGLWCLAERNARCNVELERRYTPARPRETGWLYKNLD